jgi:hypothetical protein
MSVCASTTPASRRYLLRFGSTMASYIVLFALAENAFRHHHPTGVGAIALALGPALAIVASIGVVGLYLTEEQDEFQQMRFVRSILWGIGLTLAFTTTRGFLELFTPIDRFPLYAVYPVFWMIVGLTQGAHSWYYRSRNE